MKVYKYRSGSKRDIKTLINNQFYSASIESLNDIQETKVKIDNNEFEIFDLMIKNTTPNSKNTFRKILEDYLQETKKFGIYSLSKKYDNELLWAYYSNSHKGFCIEYDFKILEQYQLKAEFICDVEYEKDIPIINTKDILENENKNQILNTKLLATKSKNWEHEEEVRIITGVTGNFSFYSRAVKAIYFGCRTGKKTIKLLMRLLKGRNIKYFQMQHIENLYKLEKVEIEDYYKDCSIYVNKINKFEPIIDSIIKPYQELIKKAIIIVEQEPLCDYVIDAYISKEKSINNNPMFFITFKANGKYPTVNYFISKKEIEDIFNLF